MKPFDGDGWDYFGKEAVKMNFRSYLGGSWIDYASDLCASDREGDVPSFRILYLSLRLVRKR